MSERRSESIGNLATALVAAQATMQGAIKDAENPHLRSKYADLASVWDACREPLTANGLAIIQVPGASGALTTVTTILVHKSGEWIAGDLDLTAVKNDPQGVGSAITYGRRYGLSAMVGIAPEDDDGHAASLRGSKEAAATVAEKKLDRVKKEGPSTINQPVPASPPSEHWIGPLMEGFEALKKALGEPGYRSMMKAAGFANKAELMKAGKSKTEDVYKAMKNRVAYKDSFRGLVAKHGVDAVLRQITNNGFESFDSIPSDDLDRVYEAVAAELSA